ADWDVTTVGATPGSGACAADSAADGWAKCKKVYSFLTAQSSDPSGYVSSPIWSIVDGAWRLKSYNPDGSDAFVPNRKYSGSPKPQIATVQYQAYTSPTAEYSALQSGALDIGTVPPED